MQMHHGGKKDRLWQPAYQGGICGHLHRRSCLHSSTGKALDMCDALIDSLGVVSCFC